MMYARVHLSAARMSSTSRAMTRRVTTLVPPWISTGMPKNWKLPMWNIGPEFRNTVGVVDVAQPGDRHAHGDQVGVRQHRAARPAADRRGVDDQQRGIRVDVQAGVGRVAGGQERLVAVAGPGIVAQPQRGLGGRADGPRRTDRAADLLLLPDHHLGAEVLDREGHLRRGPPPVAGAHHRPDLGRRAEQLVDPEGVLAEPQDPVARADPRRAQRVGQPVDPLVEFRPGQVVLAVGQRQLARVAAAVLGNDVPDGDLTRGHGFSWCSGRAYSVAAYSMLAVLA